jgi:hypothetical protein
MPITEISRNTLYKEYLPFRLYLEHTRGTSIRDLAQTYGFSETWTAERVEAARLCHRQVEIKPVLAAA